MQIEELGKHPSNVKTIMAEIHPARTVSPNKSPQKQENKLGKQKSLNKKDDANTTDPTPNQSRKNTPNHSRKSSPIQSRRSSPSKVPKRSDSSSPKTSRRSSPKTPRKSRDISPKPVENSGKSPKKIKSSLKQTSRSLSIETPTCVECYLSGKIDKGG